MIAIHQNKVSKIQENFKSEIEEQREKALKKLKAINKNYFDADEKKYLINVINLFDKNATINIISYNPEQLLTCISNFLPLPPNSRFYKNGKPKKALKQFILVALNYKALRSTFYPDYFQKIGIKSCIYCNSQLTISAVKNSKGEFSAKFDVDHYHSKDSYPFLSISLFNLYPACSSCNRLKSDKKIEFELYTNNNIKTIKSEYKFKLDSSAKAKYLTSKQVSEIKCTFEEPDYSQDVQTFKELFHIEGIYETQYDIIEELIIKSQMYNTSYLKSLKENFRKLNLHPELFKRTLIGNYTQDKDIHKRPMSKLVMDIAKELNLI